MRLVDQRGRSATVAITGELDVSGSALAKGFLMSLIGEGCLHLLVDMTDLRFCDVGSARALGDVHARLRGENGNLIVVSNPRVGRMLTLVWPGGPPTYPKVLMLDVPEPNLQRTVAGAVLPGRRHHPLVRGLTRPRPASRRPAPPPPEAPLPAQPPAAPSAPSPPVPSPLLAVARDTVSERRAVLERSRRLREQAARQLMVMRQQAELTCNVLTEVHERLAALHETLRARPRPCAAPALSRDGEDHHSQAEKFRRHAASSAGPRVGAAPAAGAAPHVTGGPEAP
ncbi:STAS domain-containing protein [Sphaerisporangium sp. B11E5]|uniref:STAS domain-containing protein n=1 Tax=Sphaerisporangium sp. B11E5 TaxID=3153563 RepID=UPI00325CF013